MASKHKYTKEEAKIYNIVMYTLCGIVLFVFLLTGA